MMHLIMHILSFHLLCFAIFVEIIVAETEEPLPVRRARR